VTDISQGRTVDGVVRSALNVVLNCELDGEPMAGVEYICIEDDRDGNPCLMIFTDPTLAAHVSVLSLVLAAFSPLRRCSL